MKRTVSGIEIELRKGDIAQQDDCTAVVNAANAELETGGGVAGAIHRAAGPQLANEARPMAPIQPGEAVITKGYQLPNEYVIHCLGPVFGTDKPEGELLASCYSRALDLAEKYQIDSIAFPAISTGIFGYPLREAAMVALTVFIDRAPGLQQVQKIVMVLHSSEALEVHKDLLVKLLQERRE